MTLAACSSQQGPADKQSALLEQPFTPDSVMREGDVINFQVAAPTDSGPPFWSSTQFSAACSQPQVNQVYSFKYRRFYPGNLGYYTPATPLPAQYHATLMGNRDFTRACKNLPMPDWRQVAGSDDKQQLLLDITSVEKKGDKVQFWAGHDEPKTSISPANNAPFTQTREHYVMDCSARSATLLGLYYLNAKNEVTDGQIERLPAPKAITAADEDLSRLFERACKAPESLASLPVHKQRNKVTVAADALPDVNPAVLKNIEQLHMPAPSRQLNYIEFAGTRSNREKEWKDGTAFTLSTDPTTGQLAIAHKNENLVVGRQINWRGLLKLSGREQAKLSHNTLVTKSLTFQGDWQHLNVGSKVGYTVTQSLSSNVLGKLGEDPETVECSVDSEQSAKDLHANLKGNAKALICRKSMGGFTLPQTEHYYYLVDYGFFYHARTEEKGYTSLNMHVVNAR
nr:surface-adhesin E family protein [Pseudomonas folii]